MRMTILGAVPSKKNSRNLFVRAGRINNLPNQKYKDWETASLWQLKAVPKVTNYPMSITLSFFQPDNRSRDIDNQCSSVMDMLQKAEIITNDDWQHVNRIVLMGELDKANPRVEIDIKY